jgi:hypothetical protein
MKVKDLIKQLQQFDPETSVTLGCSIESGRSFSSVIHSGYLSMKEFTGEEIREEIEDIVTEETKEEYDQVLNSLGDKVVVVNISGVSDIWD